MNLIIPMAGAGSRFAKLGISQPKYKISVKGKTLFQWSVGSLESYFCDSKFIFITRGNERDFIAKECQELGISEFETVELNHLTDGQATSVMIGIEHVKNKDGILIFNIDTAINPDMIKSCEVDRNLDGWLQLFEAPGDHWSFAQVLNSQVIQVSEKRRISNLASTGLYFFNSSDLYKRLYQYYKVKIKEEYGEVYIAPMYQGLLEEKGKVGYKVIPFESVTPLGTPEEVDRFSPGFSDKC